MKFTIFFLVPILVVKAAPVPIAANAGDGVISSRQDLTSLFGGILPFTGGQSRELSDTSKVPELSRKQVDFNSLIAELGLEESGLLGSRQPQAGGVLSGILGGLTDSLGGISGSASGQQQQQQPQPPTKPNSASSCPSGHEGRSVQGRDFPDLDNLSDLGSDLGEDLGDTLGDAADDLTSDRRQLLDPVEELVKSIPPPLGLTPPTEA